MTEPLNHMGSYQERELEKGRKRHSDKTSEALTRCLEWMDHGNPDDEREAAEVREFLSENIKIAHSEQTD